MVAIMNTESFSLAQLQGWMQQTITGNDDGAANAAVSDVVHASARLSAARHMAIYRGSYIARLRECMRNQFAALAWALGTELFEAFADEYLSAYPSHSYTLNDLGRNFAKFLQDTRPDAHEQKKEDWPDFMIELAEFEYALSLIFDEQANELTVPASEDTPDEELLPASILHLFRHRFPVCQYYLDHNLKKEHELPFAADSYCVVTRINYRLGLFIIQPAQYEFLCILKRTRSVAEARAELATAFDFAPNAVTAIWQDWRRNFISSGFFVRS